MHFVEADGILPCEGWCYFIMNERWLRQSDISAVQIYWVQCSNTDNLLELNARPAIWRQAKHYDKYLFHHDAASNISTSQSNILTKIPKATKLIGFFFPSTTDRIACTCQLQQFKIWQYQTSKASTIESPQTRNGMNNSYDWR